MEPTVTISLTQFEELTRDKKVLDWLERNVDTMFFKIYGDKDVKILDIRESTMAQIERMNGRA
jgi:hypothetical protein